MGEQRRSRSSLRESRELFRKSPPCARPQRQGEAAAKPILHACQRREGQYVVKILTGDLRIGLREGLVEEAIAKAFDVALDQVRGANMLLGDIGQTRSPRSRGRNCSGRSCRSFVRSSPCLRLLSRAAEAVWQRFVVRRRRSAARRHQRAG